MDDFSCVEKFDFLNTESKLPAMADEEPLSFNRLAAALEMLGGALADRGLSYEVVVVGGAAMMLNSASSRTTQDVDAIAIAEGLGTTPRRVHVLPVPLAEAARDVAAAMGLEEDWLNVSVGAFVPPLEVEDVLPDAASNLYGGLRVTVANRPNLAKLKLYAAVDEGPGSVHERDLRDLALAPAEVDLVLQWYLERFKGREDPNLPTIVARVWGRSL